MMKKRDSSPLKKNSATGAAASLALGVPVGRAGGLGRQGGVHPPPVQAEVAGGMGAPSLDAWVAWAGEGGEEFLVGPPPPTGATRCALVSLSALMCTRSWGPCTSLAGGACQAPEALRSSSKTPALWH